MKKSISFILIISIILLFSSCETSNSDIESNNVKLDFTVEDDDFLYELDGNNLFTVADNGNLYYINMQEADKSVIALNLKGEKVGEGKIDDFNGMINNVAVMDKVFYFTFYPFKPNVVEITGTVEIYSYNFDTEKQEKIAEIEDFTEIDKIVPVGGKLYLIGKDDKLKQNATYSNEHNYDGESVKSVDLLTGKIETAFESDKMPVMIAETQNNSVMLYAYDENDGYYFRELNSDKKTINKNTKLSENFQIYDYSNFEIYGESSIIYTSYKSMYLSPINDNSDAKIIYSGLSGVPGNDFFVSKSGNFFLKVDNGIKRVFINKLLEVSNDLNLTFTNPYSMDMPSPDLQKLNFKIDSNIVEYYDFSLSILSQDSQYDLYYLHSWNDISDNIRRKGAFYSLNDVPYVKEYIDACFPYVKEAAYDDNGDVWMIPIKLQTGAIAYNELLCKEYNIEPTSIKTFEELVEVLIKVRDMDLQYELYFSGQSYFEKYFYQIMKKNNGFNLNEFQNMAEYFHEKINYIKSDWNYMRYVGIGIDPDSIKIKKGPNSYYDFRGKILLNNTAVPDISENIKKALGYEDFSEEDFWKIIDENTNLISSPLNYLSNRYMMFPTIEGMTESDVTLEFIAVNPNSKNLDAVLDYISKLCEYQLNLENSFILKDKSTYSDRHFINDMYNILNYEGNYIRFSLDSELIYSDFEKYLGDEITLDEYLNRIEYKINAYLNE